MIIMLGVKVNTELSSKWLLGTATVLRGGVVVVPKLRNGAGASRGSRVRVQLVGSRRVFGTDKCTTK